VRTEYSPHGRIALSVTSLPDGEKRYQNEIYKRTTTHMTADEIHQLGLREMDRIEAEMLTIAKKEGFTDLASFRTWVKTNPKYIRTSAEQILNDFRHYVGQMHPKLPELFTALPKSSLTVEQYRVFRQPPQLITSPVRRMENVPGRLSLPHPISLTAHWQTTRPSPTTKVSLGITCSY
jgi:uncharacterized protein (DUF885 family)